MKLAGSFQRRLSCFLFRESGCLQSPRLSAPRQSIRPSPITTLLRFLTLVTQQPNPRGGRGEEEKASLTRSCRCFHLSPPVPQFPLTHRPPPSYNSSWLLCLVTLFIDVEEQWRSAADIAEVKIGLINILRISVAYLMQRDLSSVSKLNFVSSKWCWLRSVTGEIYTFLLDTLSIPPRLMNGSYV